MGLGEQLLGGEAFFRGVTPTFFLQEFIDGGNSWDEGILCVWWGLRVHHGRVKSFGGDGMDGTYSGLEWVMDGLVWHCMVMACYGWMHRI